MGRVGGRAKGSGEEAKLGAEQGWVLSEPHGSHAARAHGERSDRRIAEVRATSFVHRTAELSQLARDHRTPQPSEAGARGFDSMDRCGARTVHRRQRAY